MRVLMVGPSHIIAFQRPFSWAVNAGHDVLLLAGGRIRDGVNNQYRYVPLLAHSVHRIAMRILGRQVAAALYILFGALQVRLVAWWFKPELVHAHHLKLDAGMCALAGIKPLVVSIWGGLRPGEREPEQLNNRWRMIRLVMQKAKAFIVETPLLEQQVRALAGNPAKIAVIPLGADPKRFRPQTTQEANRLRQKWGIPADATVLLSPRGCIPIYRHHHILEAFARSRECCARDTVLVFVSLLRGSPADAAAYEHRLRDRAAELRVEKNVRWIPQRPYSEMPDIYALSDIVLSYPSYDTAPATLVEAVLCGKAVLASRVANIEGSLLEHFVTLVKPEDPAALAEAMSQALQAPSGQGTSCEARERFAAHYNERGAAERILRFYEEVVVTAYSGSISSRS